MDFSYQVQRATKDSVLAAIKYLEAVLLVPVSERNIIGSSRLLLTGYRADAGDVDVAIVALGARALQLHSALKIQLDGRCLLNDGTKIGSYAVFLNGKTVKIDVMYVRNLDWAKWVYHSSEKSNYPGAVRNIILFTALAHTQEIGKDFVLRNPDGTPYARASRSIRMDVGMLRLFKLSRINKKTGRPNKTMDRVEPAVLEEYLQSANLQIPFSHEVDLIDDPEKVAAFIFGPTVKASQLLSAEDVIARVHQLSNSADIVRASADELRKARLPVPDEL
jgi:hypothetical protein